VDLRERLEAKPIEALRLSEGAPLFNAFAAHLVRLRRTGLDVVIVLDTTGSMGGVIFEAKARFGEYMTAISRVIPEARFGLVFYRDLKEFDNIEYEYTVRVKQFTTDNESMGAFLRTCESYGGGDEPEAVCQGLEAAMRLDWRDAATKIIILIGDAPPRPENDGLSKTLDLCRKWHERTGGLIYAIDTGKGVKVIPEYGDIAKAGAGEATMLVIPRDLNRQLLLYTFGTEWRGPHKPALGGAKTLDAPANE
jgi:hypothetical protein